MSGDGTMSKENKHATARHLSDVLYPERAVFTIGGTISSAEPSSLSTPKGFLPSPTSKSHPVVTIGWKDLGDDRTCRTVSLPLLGNNGQEEFGNLVHDYHKGHLSEFIVNFSLYNYSIVDAVSRLLCPGYGFPKHRKVKAQLSSLDICSSDRTKTLYCNAEPCSDENFGRLLVCLPCKHQEGSLTLLRQEYNNETETLELDWAKESGSCKIQWTAFLNPTDILQHRVTSGHSIVLTYTLQQTSHSIGKAPVPLPILDITTHSWYRKVQNMLSRIQSLNQAEITLGYSCTGNYSFPLINLSPSAGNSLQGLLTGSNLLVYHILAQLTRNVRTHIILDEPPVIQHSPEQHPRPIVIPDSQDNAQDAGNSDNKEETQNAANLPQPDLPEHV